MVFSTDIYPFSGECCVYLCWLKDIIRSLPGSLREEWNDVGGDKQTDEDLPGYKANHTVRMYSGGGYQ